MYHKILDNCSLAINIKRLSVKKECHNSIYSMTRLDMEKHLKGY